MLMSSIKLLSVCARREKKKMSSTKAAICVPTQV